MFTARKEEPFLGCPRPPIIEAIRDIPSHLPVLSWGKGTPLTDGLAGRCYQPVLPYQPFEPRREVMNQGQCITTKLPGSTQPPQPLQPPFQFPALRWLARLFCVRPCRPRTHSVGSCITSKVDHTIPELQCVHLLTTQLCRLQY